MAVWLPAQNKFYLPPQPVTRIISTDDYVERTALFYHTSTDKLLTVGHPYYEITDTTKNEVTVPKVSPNQYRVFRLKLPDPNTFAFGDKCVYDPDSERLVWACRGIEVGRGGPLGASITGNPLYNKGSDVENPFTYPKAPVDADNRVNVGFDPKQTQMILLGCKPAIGEHWKKSIPCSGTTVKDTDCPPIELQNTDIEDGDMVDIGLGNMDFAGLQDNKAQAPLDVVRGICKYPDFIKMEDDIYGDTLFFFARRETMYARHMFLRGGVVGGEKAPTGAYIPPPSSGTDRTAFSDAYQAIPSGSLISSESQLFNRPYWIQRAQGQNNGVAWKNELFLTVVDNTRGTVLSINKKKSNASESEFKPTEYYDFVRHTEVYQVSLILQLCRVQLTPENLAFIHTMDSSIVDDWHLSVNAPASAFHEHYRYITSLATKCPDAVTPVEPEDRYKGKKFWEIDLTERVTDQLDQTALGRKFLYQTGLGNKRTAPKRVSMSRSTVACTKSPACKRKRKSCAK